MKGCQWTWSNALRLALVTCAAALLLACLPLCGQTALAADPVEINPINFPDAIFREYVTSSYDLDLNGYLSDAEIANATSIQVDGKSISSLEGIEFLPYVTYLNCRYNNLDALDVSRNGRLTTLYCDENNLSRLNVSNLSSLLYLTCAYNNLKLIDVSGNAALSTLDCAGNNLTSLNLSRNTNLKKLLCKNNHLTSLNISSCPALTYISCEGNALTHLDASLNNRITSLYTDNNRRTIQVAGGVFSLDALSGFNPDKASNWSGATYNASTKSLSDIVFGSNITYLYDCGWGFERTFTLVPESSVSISQTNFPDSYFRQYVSSNIDTNGDGKLNDAERLAVKSINVSSIRLIENLKGVEYFTAMTYLNCSGNKLSSLNVTRNTALTELDCQQNSLKTLDVSKNTKLRTLNINGNQLTEIDLSKNSALTGLNCFGNNFSKLDVSKNTALQYLRCYSNSLSSLDVTANTALTLLDCHGNGLSSLNVTKNTGLTGLWCDSNALTTLDVSKNTKLTMLACGNNRLTALNLDQNPQITMLACTGNSLSVYPSAGELAFTQLSQINPDRASGWTGAVPDAQNTKLTGIVIGTPITYQYNCGRGHIVSFTLTPKAIADLVVSVESDHDDLLSAQTGDYITWKVSATGGLAPYQYRIAISKNRALYSNAVYNSNSTRKFRLPVAGTYTATAYVKDSRGVEASVISKEILVTSSLTGTVTGTYDATLTARTPDPVTWVVVAKGGYGKYQYRMDVYRNDALYSPGAFAEENNKRNFLFYLPGTYKLVATIKDQGNTEFKVESKSIVVTSSLAATVKSTLDVDLVSTIGQTATWTAQGSGGYGTLEYKIDIYRDNKLLSRGSYPATTRTFRFLTKGVYKAFVTVKDAMGTEATVFSKEINVSGSLSGKVICNLEDPSNPDLKLESKTGKPITWTVTGEGGMKPYQYRIAVFRNGSPYSNGTFSASNTRSFTTIIPGVYRARAFIKDSLGTEYYVDGRDIEVTSSLAVTVTSNRDSTLTAKTGDGVRWTAAASGGYGKYQYRFAVFLNDALLSRGTEGETNTRDFEFTLPGNYKVIAYVSDEYGTQVEATSKVISVTSSLTVSVVSNRDSSPTAKTGESITWSVSAAGGYKSHTYRVDVYRNNLPYSNGTYTTSSTRTFKFPLPGVYKGIAYVQDEAGSIEKITSKEITVTSSLGITFGSDRDKLGAAVTGQSITWRVVGKNGYGKLQYKVDIYKDGNLFSSGTYGTSDSRTYTFGLPGEYYGVGYVKDQMGTTEQAKGVSIKVTSSFAVSVTSTLDSRLSGSVNQKVTWTARASGGIAPYLYRIEIYRNNTLLSRQETFDAPDNRVFAFPTPGKYKAVAYAMDSAGSVVQASSKEITVSGKYVAEIKVDKTTANVGESATWTVDGFGGTGNQTYCIDVYRNGNLYSKGSYSTARTRKFTFVASGTYYAIGYAKDSKNAIATSPQSPSIAVSGPLMADVSVNTGSTSVGQQATWTVTASGGTAPYTYRIALYRDGQPYSLSSFSSSRTRTFKFVAPGTFHVIAYVRDAASTEIQVKSANTVVASTLAASVSVDSQSIGLGGSITWTAAATGGAGGYKYRFEVYRNGALISKGTEGTSNKRTFTPPTAGEYSVIVYVVDGYNTKLTVTQCPKVEVSGPLAATVSVNTGSTSVGQQATWTVTASGGTAPYTYRIALYRDGQPYSLSSFGSSRTRTFKFVAPGTFHVIAYVRDAASTEIQVKSANTVVASTLAASVSVNSQSIPLGGNIVWTANATGGAGGYKYRFEVYRDGVLLSRGTEGTSNSRTFTPPTAGVYHVIVYVVDGYSTRTTVTQTTRTTVQ